MQNDEARQFVLEELMLVKAIPIAGNLLAVLCHYQPAAAEGIYLSQVLTVDHAGHWKDVGRFRWHGVDIALRGNAELLVLGRDGQIGSISAGVAIESWLEKGRAMGPMRGIVSIGDKTLAFGMNRHAYIADGTGWRRFESGFDGNASPDAEIDFDTLLDDMGGLNAVTRTAPDEFVAVGMNGEIWRSPTARDAWVKQDSSTNVGLSAVFIDADGSEIASGQAGIVLRNPGAGWSELPYTGPERLDFTSAVASASGMLLADGHSLRRLKNGVLELVDMGTPQVVPAVKLAAGFAQVVGCAPKELFFSPDGSTWTLLL
jgi:hypothetical protein